MKILPLLAVFLLFAIPAMAADPQMIHIDDEHFQMQQAGEKAPPTYLLHPSESIELVASSYEFKIPASLHGKHPNSVQLILGKNRSYSMSWPSDGDRVELSKATLTPNPGSKPFTGFTVSESGVVAVGILDEHGFSVIWVGIFNVQ